MSLPTQKLQTRRRRSHSHTHTILSKFKLIFYNRHPQRDYITVKEQGQLLGVLIFTPIV